MSAAPEVTLERDVQHAVPETVGEATGGRRFLAGLRLGEALVALGHASPEEILDALAEQRRTGERLGDILVARGVITRRQLYEALAHSMSVPFVDLTRDPPDPGVTGMLPARVVRARRVLPVRVAGGALVLGMCDPRDMDALCEAEIHAGMPVSPCLVDEVEFDRIAASLVEIAGDVLAVRRQKPAASLVIQVSPDRDGAGGEVVERVLEIAARLRGTDVHLNPVRTGYSIDIRVDGRLRSIGHLDAESGQQAVSRLKVLAGMDVAERLKPQDGHFDAEILGRAVDVRVSTVGTPLGEKLSARLLERKSPLLGLDRLGFTPEQSKVLRSVLRAGVGMVLFCGPVGSGKTTAMFSCMAELEREPLLLVSVEDPAEYTMERVVQVEVREKAGLDFEAALRSVLRHDPDVIAVGEIRDAGTARLAANAAMAGRLVLATVHSASPAGALVRLADMGVAPRVLASAVRAVVGCSLVRMVCRACDRVSGLHRCLSCGGSGYFGRTGIFEVMLVGERARSLILSGADVVEISRAAEWIPEGGARAVASWKVISGVTDAAEVDRVLGGGVVFHSIPENGGDR